MGYKLKLLLLPFFHSLLTKGRHRYHPFWSLSRLCLAIPTAMPAMMITRTCTGNTSETLNFTLSPYSSTANLKPFSAESLLLCRIVESRCWQTKQLQLNFKTKPEKLTGTALETAASSSLHKVPSQSCCWQTRSLRALLL